MVDALSTKTKITTTMMSIWTLTKQLANQHPWLVGPRLICSAIVGMDLLDWILAIYKSNNRHEPYMGKAIYGNSPSS